MNVRRFAILFVPFCAGAGLLVLALAASNPDLPTPLPPPFFSTHPALLRLPPPPTAPADVPAVTLAAAPYRHPSGAFLISYPESWQLDESEDSAQFTAPDDLAQFSVTFEAGEAALHGDYEAGLRATWSDLDAFVVEPLESAGSPDRWRARFSFEQTLLPDQTLVKVLGLVVQQPRGTVLYTFTALKLADYETVLDPVMQSIANSLQTDPNAAIENSE
jgi:hypothetical protein